MNYVMQTLEKSKSKNFSNCVDELINEAQRIEHKNRSSEGNRQVNPQLSISKACFQERANFAKSSKNYSEETEEDIAYFEAFAARAPLKRECFNCGQIGHGWIICEAKMESCFKCMKKFGNMSEYHHPRDCENRPQQSSALGKRPLQFQSKQGNMKLNQQGFQVSSKNVKRIHSETNSWTPDSGGVILNKETGGWEYRGPLQNKLKKLTVKSANGFDQEDSSDNDLKDNDSDNNV
jgi:hypothetical protein